MDYQMKMNAWLESELVNDADKEYIRQADEDTQKEMFGSDLHFGTAGMRALLGPGSARLNLLTVRRATIGVASFLLAKYGKEAAKERGFAISFDNRHFSKEFRDMAAKVLTEQGFSVFTFRDPHPTPELSYTVRHLHCLGGLMLTASHNPKEYNGYKVYDEEGCQAVYENIDGLIAEIDKLPDELSATYEPLEAAEFGKVTFLDDDDQYDIDFVNKEVATSLYKDVFEGERLTKIVFTPECGCDVKVGPMALRAAGYEVSTVPGQDFFDPDFTGTPNPNPETEEAYLAAFDHIKKLNADGGKFNIIMATEIIGLSHAERQIVANVVKFNTADFLYYDKLALVSSVSREEYLVIAKLTAILRAANSLDRSHLQKIPDVTVQVKGDSLVITAHTDEDLTLEKGTLEAENSLLEQVLSLKPKLRQKRVTK